MNLDEWSADNIRKIASGLGLDTKGNKPDVINTIVNSRFSEQEILEIAQKYPLLPSVRKRKSSRNKSKSKKQSKKQSKKNKSNKSKKKIAKSNNILDQEQIVQKILGKILPLLENYNERISHIEENLGVVNNNTKNTGKKKPTIKTIYKLIKDYHEISNNRIGDMVPIPLLINKICKDYGYDKKTLGDMIYTLFHKGYIDLQPGKARLGESLNINGSNFYWLSVLK